MVARPSDMDVGKTSSHRLNVVHLNKKKFLEGLSINVCSSSSIMIKLSILKLELSFEDANLETGFASCEQSQKLAKVSDMAPPEVRI